MEAQVTLAASELGYFSESSLCEKQMKATASFASGNDVFVSLPTGFWSLISLQQLASVAVQVVRQASLQTSSLLRQIAVNCSLVYLASS